MNENSPYTTNEIYTLVGRLVLENNHQIVQHSQQIESMGKMIKDFQVQNQKLTEEKNALQGQIEILNKEIKNGKGT